MANFINVPTLDIDFLKPRRFSFDTPGGGLEGGRNGLGESITIGLSGGPIVAASYQECYVQTSEEHEYLNWVAGRMNGGFRFVNVQLLTDWAGPFPFMNRTTPQPIISGIPHSDTSLFSDGAGYSQATVFGTFAADAPLNSGEISINIFGNTRNLRWSDWFSIYHSVKGWRATRYYEASDPVDVTATVDGETYTGQRYTLAIEVPLRQAVEAGTRIEFARPRCVMKFPVGFTVPWEAEGFWLSRPTIRFTEAF
jgi:hypothetical protein